MKQLTYTMMFKTKNSVDDNKKKPPQNTPQNKKSDKKTQSHNGKRKRRESYDRNAKKQKKNYKEISDSSDSDDSDYEPSDSSDTNTDSDSLEESEYELISENKKKDVNIKISESKSDNSKAVGPMPMTEEEMNEEYEQYLDQLAKEMENINPDDLIMPLFINLKDYEQDLHREFTEVRRFWMKDMPDLYIRGAGISGVKLQNSPEYQRYVRQVGGKLMSMVFRWQGITILLSGDGLIFTYTNFNSNLEASRFFKRIIDKLIRIDALEYPF